MRRREFLAGIGAAPLAASLTSSLLAQAPQGGRGQGGRGAAAPATPAAPAAPARPRTKIQQSVMGSVWGSQNNLPIEEKCKILQRIGFKGMDLPTAAQVPVIKQYGLAPAMMTLNTGTSFTDGLIRKERHDMIETATKASIDQAVTLGCSHIIMLPGEKRGMSPAEGADNAVAIFNRLKGYAEQKGVTLSMEITNSKVVQDARTDQIFNHLAWGIDVCKRVNSPRVKIVFDCYHVQISDGDLVRNLRDNFDHVAHIHVAGVPTRADLDDTQEVNWRFVANAIADLGYTGYVALETQGNRVSDPLKSLEQNFAVLNV
jgi:hydroxypyruvate isomerase